MALPTLEIERAKQATTQLIVQTFLSVLLSVGLFGFALTTPEQALRWLFGFVGFANLLILGLRVMTLINSRFPLRITEDQVIIASSAKVTVPRSNVTGAGFHPKHGHPCLFYDDPKNGHNGPLRLPLRFIAMDHKTLHKKLVETVGEAQ